MQLAPIAPFITVTNAPAPTLDDAVTRLDWAHETAGSMTSVDAEYLDASTILSARDDAMTAAEILTSLEQSEGARQARLAAEAFDSAAHAILTEDPEAAVPVVEARGDDAETAIHAAFTAIGHDGRGE